MVIRGIEEAVEAVIRQRARWNYPMQPPCTEQQIDELARKTEKELCGTVATRYLDLLRMADGISENALVIYASRTGRNVVSDIVGRELEVPGIIEVNQFQRLQEEAYKDVILYAYREEYFYAQVIDSGRFIKFCETDLEGPIRAFYDTFDQMIIAAIESALVLVQA